ncbi:MAG: hypothetical protein IPM92_11965 [Saprospiraceae bacterium]|nr:hypothetical protein [Saprospiraceae bacterium]
MSVFRYISILILAVISQVCLCQSPDPQVIRIHKGIAYFNNGDSLLLERPSKNPQQSIFLLFHAEEDTIGMDPGLSIQGRYRAIHLLKLFKELDMRAFYSTPFRNNVLTVQPLLDSKRIELIYYDQADIAALVQKIDHIYPASVMIVVHPQTIHKILSQLTGKELSYKPSGNLSEKLVFLNRNKTNGSYLLKNMRYAIR